MKIYQIYCTSLIISVPNPTGVVEHYKFKKFFSFLVILFKCCYYCSQCFNPINVNPVTTLRACSVCNTAINLVKDLSYFIHIPILEQIQSLFSRKTFFNNLLH